MLIASSTHINLIRYIYIYILHSIKYIISSINVCKKHNLPNIIVHRLNKIIFFLT